MTVELQWYYDGNAVDEDLNPLPMTEGVSYSLVLRNIGSTKASNVGFYLSQASVDPVAEIGTVYLSTNGVEIDLYEILAWGAAGGGDGYFISQGGSPVVATPTTGGGASSPIPLTVGTGASSNEIDPGAEVTISVLLVSAAAAQRKYVNLSVYYEED